MENSLHLNPEDLEKHNWDLARGYQSMASEVRHETSRANGKLDVPIVACGTVARVARMSVEALREKNLKVGGPGLDGLYHTGYQAPVLRVIGVK